VDRIEKLRQFLEIDPTDNFIQHALALELVKAGDDAAAQKLFEDILQRDPGYVGSYYHLAKLFERNGKTELAIKWYQKGMEEARRTGESKALSELKSAYEELTF